jgi:cilia- and flagella-associated protein 57
MPTTIALSRSGRMLFVGTSKGKLRSYKFPLTNQTEFQEHLAHTAPITRMKITFNDEYSITASEDGTIVLWKIQDKEGRSIKRDKETGFAEEILITKSDLEEKNQLMVELRNRVNELKTENEYQLRLKDMSSADKMKELTEKFIQEMESLKTKNHVLKTEKEKAEQKHESDSAAVLERQNKELQDLENTNNQKLMMEYEKYQDLQSKTQKIQEEYERQISEMEQNREKAINEMQEHYEDVIHKMNIQLEKLQEEINQQTREYEETKRQIEEDCDTETIDIKTKYEKKMKEQVETIKMISSEANNVKKRIGKMEQDAKESKKNIEQLNIDVQKGTNIISSLRKDIDGLKKEIQERDDTIQDKEKRIYDLKKKNQELEKFKFVLDYKIKEQKQMVEPREKEIKDLKEEKTKMESELERFNKQNTQLELSIKEAHSRLDATNKELRAERAIVIQIKIQKNSTYFSSFFSTIK